MTTINQKDLEKLSAYIDQELDGRAAARLETRLQKEPVLREELESLQLTRQVLRASPQLRAPRNFTLTPEMAGAVQPARNSPFNIARFAFAIASVFLVFSLVGSYTFGSLPLMDAGISASSEAASEPEPMAMEAPEAETAEDQVEAESLPVEESMEDSAADIEVIPEQEVDQTAEDASGDGSQTELPAGGGMVPEPTPGETLELAPPTDESQAMVVEEAVESSEEAERSMAVDEGEASSADRLQSMKQIEEPEPVIAEAPADDGGVAAAGPNIWTIAAWISGVAAVLSGGLALLLRRR